MAKGQRARRPRPSARRPSRRSRPCREPERRPPSRSTASRAVSGPRAAAQARLPRRLRRPAALGAVPRRAGRDAHGDRAVAAGLSRRRPGHTVLDTHLDWVLAVRQIIDKAGLAGADLRRRLGRRRLCRRNGGDLARPRAEAGADRAVRPVRRGRSRRPIPGPQRKDQVAGLMCADRPNGKRWSRRRRAPTRSNGRSRWTRASEAAARAFWPLGNTRLEKRLRPDRGADPGPVGRATTPCCRRAMRRNSPTASTARRGSRPSPAPAISPISTSPKRSPGPCWSISSDAFVVARAGGMGIVRRVAVSRGYEPMTIRSINWAAGVSILAATLAFAGSLPAAAQGPVQAVPRAGVSFPTASR